MTVPKTALDSYVRTAVAPHQSKADIEALLERVGATGFRWSSLVGVREILEAGLKVGTHHVAFRLQVDFSSEKERKQRLRALYWYLKAKIEAIQFGLVDLEREFLPYLLTTENRTVFDELSLVERKGWLLEAPQE